MTDLTSTDPTGTDLPRLSTAALPRIASDTSATTPTAVPSYDRAATRPGIVHIGVGGFHRAHQAMYLDRLMTRGRALDWAVTGLGVMPSDVRMRDALTGQDHLYTLTTKAPDGTEDRRVIGSITGYVFAPDDPGAAVRLLTDPSTRIVSLTVTEGATTRTTSPAGSSPGRSTSPTTPPNCGPGAPATCGPSSGSSPPPSPGAGRPGRPRSRS